MNISTEDSSNLSNNTINEDAGKKHSYGGDETAKGSSHLSDHDYFTLGDPQARTKASQKKKHARSLKITQLRAVYNCKSCGHRTMNRDLFSKHRCVQLKTIASTKCDQKVPDGYNKCPKCSYFNKSLPSLKIHMHMHENGKSFKCTECDFCGKDCKSLILHYGKTKNLNCDCGYRTHVRQHFEAHLRSHTGEKPFSCAICCFSCSTRAVLSRHIKKKHECI